VEKKMKTTLCADEIRTMLPHRWPFLLLDRVTELVPDKYAVGLKNVTISEPYFEGHFPQRAIMPGVLIIEAMAQLTAIVYCSGHLARAQQEDGVALSPSSNVAERVGYLVSIRNMKFMRPVTPGDQLVLKASVCGGHSIFSQVKVSAHVGSFTVAEGMLGVTQSPEATSEVGAVAEPVTV
jgi:3-hydroxyacyl-[acyl-carrier-protein] dehydratase